MIVGDSCTGDRLLTVTPVLLVQSIPLYPLNTSPNAMSTPCPLDELTSTVCNAVQSLNHLRKANFLLDTSLALIEAGRCLLLSR